MTKILFLQNCQGAAFANFLQVGSETFRTKWQVLKTIQAQSIQERDASFFAEQLDQADVVVAQPLYSMPAENVRMPALKEWAARTGKQLIAMPALQYEAVLAGFVPSRWGPTFPFAANESVLIAAAYLHGLSAAETARKYHSLPLLTEVQLQNRVAYGIAEYKKREDEADCVIKAADYYAEHWQSSRLHYAKGHPLPGVMRHFTDAIAQQLGIDDFDPAKTAPLKAAFQFCAPIPRWIKDRLNVTFEDDEDVVCRDGEYITLIDFVKEIFSFYDAHGKTEVDQRLKKMPMYDGTKRALRG